MGNFTAVMKVFFIINDSLCLGIQLKTLVWFWTPSWYIPVFRAYTEIFSVIGFSRARSARRRSYPWRTRHYESALKPGTYLNLMILFITRKISNNRFWVLHLMIFWDILIWNSFSNIASAVHGIFIEKIWDRHVSCVCNLDWLTHKLTEYIEYSLRSTKHTWTKIWRCVRLEIVWQIGMNNFSNSFANFH